MASRGARFWVGCASLACSFVAGLWACVSEDTGPLSGADAATTDTSTLDVDNGNGDAADQRDTGVTLLPDGGFSCRYRLTVLNDQPIHYYRFRRGQIVDDVNPELGNDAGRFLADASTAAPSATPCEPDDESALVTPARSFVELFGSDYDFVADAPFSIELWFLPAPAFMAEGYGRLLSHETINTKTTVREGYTLTYRRNDNTATSPGSLNFSRLNGKRNEAGAEDLASLPIAPYPTTFRHVVATFNGTNLIVFLDGMASPPLPSPITIPAPSGVPLRRTLLGGRFNDNSADGDGQFLGRIDEVAIYDKPLSAERVREHFQAR